MQLYDIARPLFFMLPAETAHHTVHWVLRLVQATPIQGALASRYVVQDDRLESEVFDCEFPNPVGVAAGFDKNARIPPALAALGFGFVEVGGVTAEPQSGNPRPRMFRLEADRALVNRMGLNNDGAEVVGDRLARTGPATDLPVGVNVAKTETVGEAEAPADYRETYEAVAAGADFVVVNVSCPNSQGFEDLQNRESMAAILQALQAAGAAPLLVKLSPDLPEPALDDAVDLVTDLGLDGIVAVNTTTSRPDSLHSPDRDEEGGLSGEPLEPRATEVVRFVARRTDVPVVGVGGVSSAADAYEKIRAGASLVQLYTGLVYEGPALAREINRGLVALLERDGFDSVEDAVGADL
ncbi:MAG: quinone-dependent dihydroorotate dehydrogenase [Haloarculaceae archaeon]